MIVMGGLLDVEFGVIGWVVLIVVLGVFLFSYILLNGLFGYLLYV